MKKKILVMLLAMVMVVGLLPVTSFAIAKSITSVSISVPAPAAGKTVDASSKLTTGPASAASILTGEDAPVWLNEDEEVITGKFQPCTLYYYFATVKSKSGYQFDFDEHGEYTGNISVNGALMTYGFCDDDDPDILYVLAFFAPALCIDGESYTEEELKNDISGRGWSWNAASQKLTLNKYIGGFINMYRQLDLVLADGSNNTITVPRDSNDAALASLDSCSITGNGNLNISALNIDSSGIAADSGDIKIKINGDLDIKCGNIGIASENSVKISGKSKVAVNTEENGIYANQGDVTVSGSAEVDITAAFDGIYASEGSVILKDNAKLNVESTRSYAITFHTSEKAVFLEGNGAPLKFRSANGYRAVYNSKDNNSPVTGSCVGYYNNTNGSPKDSSVIFDTHYTMPFTDVLFSDWFFQDVNYAFTNQLMNGTSGSTFSPSDNTTRAMIVTILYRYEGSPEVEGENTFADVESGMWYTDPITWAQQNNIVNGISETAFAPADSITREQMATILYRYTQSKGGGFHDSWAFLLEFDDTSDISSFANEAMHWCVMTKLINGVGDNKLDPKGNATRAQIAAILHRFCELK